MKVGTLSEVLGTEMISTQPGPDPWKLPSKCLLLMHTFAEHGI